MGGGERLSLWLPLPTNGTIQQDGVGGPAAYHQGLLVPTPKSKHLNTSEHQPTNNETRIWYSLMSVRHISSAWGRSSQALATAGAGLARAEQTVATQGWPSPLNKIHPGAPNRAASNLGNL